MSTSRRERRAGSPLRRWLWRSVPRAPQWAGPLPPTPPPTPSRQLRSASLRLRLRLAAAQEAVAQQRSGRDCSPAPGHGMSPHPHQPPPGAKGPTSLFILSEDNPIRRYTRFIIEWPYPLTQTSTRNKLCNVFHKNQMNQ
ncbi:uncharacterized protein LOC126471039 [Schistocerca serialis cubense]|uniref:uncharacterized protein LOC126471039 n=1 Tax=Schistocerca serialis cubense TaxID=2023355 RepID=UPI00214EF9C4|nr:uncharacterized protein LOC126471039 [Schistocerca serialis cubense]